MKESFRGGGQEEVCRLIYLFPKDCKCCRSFLKRRRRSTGWGQAGIRPGGSRPFRNGGCWAASAATHKGSRPALPSGVAASRALNPALLTSARGCKTPDGRGIMDVQVAPLRSWDDFIPGHDRFAVPDFKDISKWNNRVVSNLLYYQTNYLVVAAAVISIVG